MLFLWTWLKALDRVDHPTLLHRLCKFGITGNPSGLVWRLSYTLLLLVTVKGSTSCQLPVTSGVPQGSLFGLFLFKIYVNDIPTTFSDSIDVGLFADDTKPFRCIERSEDAVSLESDVDCFNVW